MNKKVRFLQCTTAPSLMLADLVSGLKATDIQYIIPPPPPRISGADRTSPSEAQPAGTPFFHTFYSYTIIIQNGEDSTTFRTPVVIWYAYRTVSCFLPGRRRPGNIRHASSCHETPPSVIRKDNPAVDDTFDHKNNKPKTLGNVFVGGLFFNKRYRNEKNVPDDIGASAFLRRRFVHRISGRFSASVFLLPDARGIVRMDERNESLHLCENENSDMVSLLRHARLLRRKQRLNLQVKRMNVLE
jgi:hypothetical protein